MLLRRLREQGVVPVVPKGQALEAMPTAETLAAERELAALAWASAVLGTDLTAPAGSRDWTWSWLL